MPKKIKLTVELIPKTCHFSNVRTTVKPSEWDKIRFLAYEKANNQCEICGGNGIDQGYRHRVECHEIWKYNDTKKVQKLVGLIALCPLCHQVKHIGRAMAIGKQAEAFQHLATVNDWDHKQVIEHVAQEFETYKGRSKFSWILDISLLSKAPYEIQLKPTTKRKFKKSFKYKKKRKKRTTRSRPS